ncbi:MAG: ESPR domain-containing protein, partial [Candidatus Riflebacteria bacterium]|nr:ESPR domain-containing protein [Candidatus Riflebacteria bacterium]
MNKIFKVIWNNAKHCYIVASELAKSYCKGGGSRTIRRAMAALCISVAVYAAAGSAIAANTGGNDVVVSDSQTDYVGTENEQHKYEVTITENVTGYVYGHKEDNENVEEASVKITSGYVGKNVYGGYSIECNSASNSVNISGGTVNSNVFGGWSYSGNAASNSVDISGDTTKILGNIYGG